MSFEYRIDSTGKVAWVTSRGNTSLGESVEAIRIAASDLHLTEGFGVLVDLRKSVYPTSWDEAEAVAAAMARISPRRNHRIALVVSGYSRFALASLIATLSGLRGAAVRAFRDLEPARAWLRHAPGP